MTGLMSVTCNLLLSSTWSMDLINFADVSSLHWPVCVSVMCFLPIVTNGVSLPPAAHAPAAEGHARGAGEVRRRAHQPPGDGAERAGGPGETGGETAPSPHGVCVCVCVSFCPLSL